MIYVFLANGFEEVEAFTPVDYLRRCELLVQTVGVNGVMAEGARGIVTLADITLSDLDLTKADMIVLPGGMPGTLHLEQSPAVIEAIHYCMQNHLPVGAICAAPSILGHLGYLKGKRATCAEGFQEELSGAYYTGEPVELQDNIITARGAGVANQFAFALVKYLLGKERVSLLKDSVRWEE